MNPTLTLIHNRRSVRRYADAPVTLQEKEAILQAAMRAPTAGNMMLYTIVEVEDQSLKDRLAVTCDNQPFIAKAPYVLLFLADYQRWMDIFAWSDAPRVCLEKSLQPRTPHEGDLMLACCDALIAAQTAVIAAESLGIGSCYIGDILENCDEHRAMFNLPRYTFPVSLVCFGHPYNTRENPGLIRRFDQKFIVHQDRYSALNTADIPILLEHASRQSPSLQPVEAAQQVAQGIYCRKFASDFSVEMSRSVRKWMAIWNDEQD